VYEHLWQGVDHKIAEAHDAWGEMWRSLHPPEHVSRNIARNLAAGNLIDIGWQDKLYGNVDTFLAKTRSVPWIIEACFGQDLGSLEMRNWWATLAADEQRRRASFSRRFRNEPKWRAFRDHDLTNERNVSGHRRGFADVEGRVVGPSGQVHIARRDKRIPVAEGLPLQPGINDDSGLMWAATLPPRPIEPKPEQFFIGGKPLFDECRAYLQLAQDIRVIAQAICDAEHQGQHVSTPPD
jgi:hypothetical protein